MKSGAHGKQDVETLEMQEEPYTSVDLKVISNKCLARTPDKDPTGWQVMGELWDDLAPLYCGLPANHEGSHAWEGLCCMAGPLKEYLISVIDACGYVYSEELTSGGPGGHMEPSITPKGATP